MGPGVIAKRIAGIAPSLEDGGAAGLFLEDGGVDETVDGRQMGVAKGGENFVCDLEASFTGRKRAVGGEIVEGEDDLRGMGFGDSGYSKEEREKSQE